MNYVRNLAEADVPVSFALFAGGIHGFDLENPNAHISKQATDLAIANMRRALHG